ncbi:hypothetical protein, partial [Mesorhizobium sp.]|uniref:hypothetical protein n=1 Tax=Mesorhizobium sp. TaxID=1871066 RepID=UPI0025F1A6BF
MVRLLVEEARHALPPPNNAQCRRDDRSPISTSIAGALPRSGFVLRPQSRRSSPRRVPNLVWTRHGFGDVDVWAVEMDAGKNPSRLTALNI